jgi:hypothetical protein
VGVNTGALYIIFIILAVTGFAYVASGPTPSQTPILTGSGVVLTNQNSGNAKANLQLYKFNGATITPPASNLCKPGGANVHPNALVAYWPPQATAISTTDQIELFVSDTKPPYISPNEIITRSSGAVKVPGDRAATAPNGYLWEPQLYVFPQTVEKDGRPYFPSWVQGDYNNGAMTGVSYGSGTLPVDSLPLSKFTVEYVWNVKDIGLTDGEYSIEFVAQDGNAKVGMRCMSLRIYTPPPAENDQNKLPL